MSGRQQQYGESRRSLLMPPPAAGPSVLYRLVLYRLVLYRLVLAVFLATQLVPNAAAAELEPETLRRVTDVDRWSITALQGSGLQMGDPTLLTWSVVPDGTTIVPNHEFESSAPSDLVETLDRTFGSRDVWYPIIQSTFDRWSAVSGLTYVSVEDDGLAINPQNVAGGVVDRRGDIRIGGHAIDGTAGLAGYSYFPNHGDIVLDTVDPLLNNNREGQVAFRNLIAHEHGHGLGFEHTVSSDASLLMENFISDFFDGPQFDEILLVQRAYGDALEKSGGNDQLFSATQLGNVPMGGMTSIGGGGNTVMVDPAETDFVSIDGITDTDYYTFEAPRTGILTVTLTPVGPTYRQAAEGLPQTELDASALNDLSIDLLSSGSIGAIATADDGVVGEPERLEFLLPESGAYTLRIEGKQDRPQLYSLSIEVAEQTQVGDGDVNADGRVDVLDIDSLAAAIRMNQQAPLYDLDGSGFVNSADHRWLIEERLGTYFGDANLDGEFNSSDLVITFGNGKYEDNEPLNAGWQDGDFNGDGEFNSADMVAAFQAGSYEQGPRSAQAVPEPCLLWWSLLPVLCLWRRAN